MDRVAFPWGPAACRVRSPLLLAVYDLHPTHGLCWPVVLAGCPGQVTGLGGAPRGAAGLGPAAEAAAAAACGHRRLGGRSLADDDGCPLCWRLYFELFWGGLAWARHRGAGRSGKKEACGCGHTLMLWEGGCHRYRFTQVGLGPPTAVLWPHITHGQRAGRGAPSPREPTCSLSALPRQSWSGTFNNNTHTSLSSLSSDAPTPTPPAGTGPLDDVTTPLLVAAGFSPPGPGGGGARP